MRLSVLLFILFGAGCTGGVSLPSQPPPIVNDLDLHGTIDGVPWDGIAVGSAASTHDIKIESKVDVNYMRIISCHRFEQYADVIKTGWFQTNRGFEYQYRESPGVEDTGLCVLRLQAYTKDVDSDGNPVGSAFGLMLFHNQQFTLAGQNICNGADGAITGTSICKSMSGLVERLKFKSQVVVAHPFPDGSGLPPACAGEFIDAQTWEYKMPAGECITVFMSTARPHEFAIHMAYGFNHSPYRGSP